MSKTTASQDPEKPKTYTPGSDNAVLLAILADGKWHSTAAIRRRHPMTVNSRLAQLRRDGYKIERQTVPGRSASRRYRYRLLNPPPELVLPTNGDEPVFSYEDLMPRTPEQRFRLYRVAEEEPVCVATTGYRDDFDITRLTAEQVRELVMYANLGGTLVSLAREGEFENANFGLLDTFGTDDKPGEWLIKPWDQR